MSAFEQQIARRAVFAEDVIFKIKSHYTAGIEWADRRFNDGLDVAISEINRADAADAKKIANAVLNQISKVADVEEAECETIPATVESAVAFLRLNGWIEAHDKKIRADERHSMEMWARNPGQGGW